MATTSLIENFQNLAVKDESDEAQPHATCLPFNPGPDSGISPGWHMQVDRYLFRLFDRCSDGSTDETWVKSRDASQNRFNYDRDVFERQDRGEAAQALRRHLQWVGPPEKEDNFVSWTSSLLVVLQYAHYRAHRFWDENFKKLFLCVVDTTLLPPMVFMRDTDLLTAFSKYDNSPSCMKKTLPKLQSLRRKKHREFSGSYYFGEYLSQGALRIEGCCSILSMQDIIDAGLYTLKEELKLPTAENEAWANRVIMLREGFYVSKPCGTADDDAVECAYYIGDMYGPTWKLPIALAFLALKPRPNWDDAMIEELRTLYSKGEPPLVLSWTRAEANVNLKVTKHSNSHLKRRRWCRTTTYRKSNNSTG
jgi:hypothetical protein